MEFSCPGGEFEIPWAGTPDATYTIVEATGLSNSTSGSISSRFTTALMPFLLCEWGPGGNGAFPLIPNLVSQTAIGGRGEKYDGGIVMALSMKLAIYTNVLSPSEILAHYQNGTNANRASRNFQLVTNQHPIVYYRLNEWPMEEPPPVRSSTAAVGAPCGWQLQSTWGGQRRRARVPYTDLGQTIPLTELLAPEKAT